MVMYEAKHTKKQKQKRPDFKLFIALSPLTLVIFIVLILSKFDGSLFHLNLEIYSIGWFLVP